MKAEKANSSFKISDAKTTIDIGLSEDELKDELKSVRKKLGKLQDTLYAHGKYAVLVCLQGMDTAGKDSLIREVFKDFNTSGIIVHSFKVPSTIERNHDYLWRHYIALPARGKFGIFNRTHYENVLVTRVHPEYILGENIPHISSVNDVDDKFWKQRFEQINDFEKHLTQNGTLIFKFFLHLSKREQKNRLLRRLEKKDKNWKFSPADLKERKLWDAYQDCYEDAIRNTSTLQAPWYVIPADHKPVARYLVAKTLYDSLSAYTDIQEPELEEDVVFELRNYLHQLKSEK
ncbi:PPK2 family polyphosphate kinase [Aquimarina agarilytica]|uniref:PPK2 family polyphosphate kinase n=1 Tax=Aquimarina agarilytica TaxID=1087449 RepID=UPI00028943AF|nr:PPK2 family polyphosphate kinase [Aquimarina agarilytica]